jgi:hypothetical protein
MHTVDTRRAHGRTRRAHGRTRRAALRRGARGAGPAGRWAGRPAAAGCRAGAGWAGGGVTTARTTVSVRPRHRVPSATLGTALARRKSVRIGDCQALRPANPGRPDSPPSEQSHGTAACPEPRRLMISVVHRPKPTRSALVLGVLAPVAVAWTCVGTPAAPALADACAYASTGPGGTWAVSVAGGGSLPFCQSPTPTPAPTPTPTPPPSPSATPTPAPTPPPRPTPRPEPDPRPTPPPKPESPAPPTPGPPPRPVPATVPLRPAPPPPPPPTPTPAHEPAPTAGTHLTAKPVTYPRYHPRPHRHTPPRGPSPLVYVLLIAVPALAAVAALRPR